MLSPADIVIGIVVVLFSLSVHESAHAWAADLLGDYTGRYLGRVSLNPIRHIDPIGTVLFPLIGMVTGAPVFGWAKPVPVNTAHLRHPRRDHVLIAAAGPASNLVAAVAFLIGLLVLKAVMAGEIYAHPIGAPMYLLLRWGVHLNILLAVFNMIPVPPLDGSWVLEGLLPDSLSGVFDAVRPYSFMLLIVLLYTGVLGAIVHPIETLLSNTLS